MKQLAQAAIGVQWRISRGPQPGRLHITIDNTDYSISHREALEMSNQLTDIAERTTKSTEEAAER